VVVLMAVACLRWRVAGTWVALSLLVLPTLPTLLVSYMPQRYLAIPYAGFVLLVALWVGALAERLSRWRLAIRGIACMGAALVMIAGAAIVRADLEDYRAIAAAHEVLLDEAAEVAGAFAVGIPVLIIRDERAQPLVEILREPQGMPKLPYTRHEDPYGLIDTAALFEWVLADEGTRVDRIEDWESVCDGVEGSVMIHREGGFLELGGTSDVASAASRWRAEQFHLRVVRPVPLGLPERFRLKIDVDDGGLVSYSEVRGTFREYYQPDGSIVEEDSLERFIQIRAGDGLFSGFADVDAIAEAAVAAAVAGETKKAASYLGLVEGESGVRIEVARAAIDVLNGREKKAEKALKTLAETNEPGRVEGAVNTVGYSLLEAERLKPALEVFEINKELFPESFNTWDSLGEAFMKQGKDAKALASCEKSLELNPENINAQEMIARIQGGGEERD
jgi:tetratricopeptide (TPR) repeat protein